MRAMVTPRPAMAGSTVRMRTSRNMMMKICTQQSHDQLLLYQDLPLEHDQPLLYVGHHMGDAQIRVLSRGRQHSDVAHRHAFGDLYPLKLGYLLLDKTLRHTTMN